MLDAIKGEGGFYMFKDLPYRYYLDKRWYFAEHVAIWLRI